MTDEIRERARAWIDELRGPFEMVEPSIDALVDLLLAERAAALGAAGDVASRRRKIWSDQMDYEKNTRAFLVGNDADYQIVRSRMVEANNIGHEIRSLVPAGWSAVRTEDLAVVKEAAHEALAHYYAPLEELQQYRGRADEIRAALARMP